MGNVIGNSSQLEKDVETEEWLRDLEDNLTLDFSRKVTHSQFLKVSIHLLLKVTGITILRFTDIREIMVQYFLC